MGKGNIISHQGSALYSVEIQYDRTGIDAAISDLEDLIAACQTIIDNPESTETQVLFAKARKLSAQKRIDYLSDPYKVPDNETVSAWCADLTTDLSGSVGTIELGRERDNGLLIQPGYNDNAVYDADRDGQLLPTMAAKPLVNFVNLGLLPGMQKWMPMYRPGTITDIDYAADTCDVALAGISSSQQGLEINQADTLSDVSINYMSCNAAAFETGDEVVVAFQNYEWTDPQVIGFADNPKACGFALYIVISTQSGDEAVAWNLATNTAITDTDTLAAVESELTAMGRTLTELTAAGEWTENSLGFGKTDQPGNLPYSILGNIWALDSGEDTNTSTILPYNPDSANWNYTEYLASSDTAEGVYFFIHPNAFGNVSGWSDGDTITFETVAGTDQINSLIISGGGTFNTALIEGDILGSITETWTIEIVYSAEIGIKYLHIYGAGIGVVDDSGAGPLAQMFWEDNHVGYTYIPYASAVDTASYVGLTGYTDYKAPFFVRCDDGYKQEIWQSDFEAATGESWPVNTADTYDDPVPGTDVTYVQREQVFFSPIFGFDLTDEIPHPGHMKAVAIDIYDSFSNGDWSQPATIETYDHPDYVMKDAPNYAANRFDAWCAAGAAEITNGAAVFDAYTFCSVAGSCAGNRSTGMHVFYHVIPEQLIEDDTALEIFNFVNEERTSRGLAALKVNPHIQTAAEQHARYMASNLQLSHIGDGGSTISSRILDAGYGQYLNDNLHHVVIDTAENVGAVDFSVTSDCLYQLIESDGSIYYYEETGGCTVAGAVAAWMASPDHRDNILNEYATETGVSVRVGSNGYTYLCQDFGYRTGAWPGFGALDVTSVQSYMASHFNWSGAGDDTRLPKLFLA